MKKIKGGRTGKLKESDARIAEWFCSVIALLTTVLCVLFLSGILRNFWVLNFVCILGILMNLSVILVSAIRKKNLLGAVGLLMLLAEVTALVYFVM